MRVSLPRKGGKVLTLRDAAAKKGGNDGLRGFPPEGGRIGMGEAVALGLTAALVAGGGDAYLLRLLRGRAALPHLVRMTSWSAVAAVGFLAVALPPLRPGEIAWGLLAGCAQLAGIGFMFRGYRIHGVSATAPPCAVLGAGIPALWEMAVAGAPRPSFGAGLALGLVALWLLAAPKRGEGGFSPARLRTGILAGAGFGLTGILLSFASPGSAWAFAAARLTTAAGFWGMGSLAPPPERGEVPQRALAILGCGHALAFYLWMAGMGYSLSAASVAFSFLYGVTLAIRIVAGDERPSPRAGAGFALALISAALLSL